MAAASAAVQFWFSSRNSAARRGPRRRGRKVEPPASQAQADAGVAGVEARRFGGQAEVGRRAQRDRAADRQALHRDDQRRVHARQPRQRRVQRRRCVAHEELQRCAVIAHGLQVGAHAEEAALGVQQHAAHARRLAAFVGQLAQLAREAQVDRMAALGLREADVRDAVAEREGDGFGSAGLHGRQIVRMRTICRLADFPAAGMSSGWQLARRLQPALRRVRMDTER
ncbi:MAG: hypothetical protein QM750_27155 [Rubrivivax sp.]